MHLKLDTQRDTKAFKNTHNQHINMFVCWSYQLYHSCSMVQQVQRSVMVVFSLFIHLDGITIISFHFRCGAHVFGVVCVNDFRTCYTTCVRDSCFLLRLVFFLIKHSCICNRYLETIRLLSLIQIARHAFYV